MPRKAMAHKNKSFSKFGRENTYNVIRTSDIKSLVSWYVYERLMKTLATKICVVTPQQATAMYAKGHCEAHFDLVGYSANFLALSVCP